MKYERGVNLEIKARESLAINNLIFFKAMAEGALNEGDHKAGLERIKDAAAKLLRDMTGGEL